MFLDSWVLDWFIILNLATLVLTPCVIVFRQIKDKSK